MKRIADFSTVVTWCLGMLIFPDVRAQVCDNLVMDFDGNADFISLVTSGTPVTGDANFTVECWFDITAPPNPNCGSSFRRLITLAGTGTPGSRFEVGECNNILKLYWSNTTGGVIPGGVTNISAALPSGCHHLAVVRNGGTLLFYLDGNITPFYSSAFTGMLNTNLFRIGHWGGGPTPGQDWQGTVDEVRLWSVPRTPTQIRDYKDCTLSGTSTGLVVNWTFDQGPVVTPGGNNTGSMAQDMSGNGNHGTFSTVANGFALTGLSSNFICNACPVRYDFTISDQIALFPVSLSQICDGDPVHFCVTYNNLAASVPSGSMVMWESSDGGGPWVPDADLNAYPPAQNALCFPIKKGVITNSNCSSAGPGFVDRKYRAKILKKMGAETCTYTTVEQSLRICCKPAAGTISILPNIPTPWCEGDNISTFVALNLTDPWLPFGPNVTIDWCLIEGTTVTPLPQYQNQLIFSGLSIIVGTQDICLQAKISNCSCPGITVDYCINVDPLPMCGTIDIATNPPAPITPVTTSAYAPYAYEICRGDYTILEMQNAGAGFVNCTPVWQYIFNTELNLPVPPWKDLGSTNSSQNTNTLPELDPVDPAFWPPGATCIYYRIECRPESWPNSGCDPCYSNIVEICLKPTPPSGFISGATQFCEGGSTTLTITPNATPPGPWNYCWYWNGVLEQCFADPVNTFVATKPGCYWVEIHDWCERTRVGPYCVEECVILPKIECPTDNPCACDGQPIALSGCNSMYTCTNTGPLPLQYSWTASNNGPCQPDPNNPCGCVHTPDPVNGTTYTLTITDPNLGCSGTSKPLTIKPCN